jgi:hypothetical protein
MLQHILHERHLYFILRYEGLILMITYIALCQVKEL